MKKFLIFSTIALASICIFGNLQQAETIWFTGMTPFTSVFLGFIVMLLVTLLIVRPPRPLSLRIVTALTGVFLLGFSWYGVLSYHVTVLEWIIYTETAIILFIEALEVTTIESVTNKKLAPASSRTSFSL